MSSRLKLTGIALAAAFALAACGGGGNGVSDGTPQTDPRDERIAELERERDNEKERADNLQNEKNQEQAAADLKTAKALFTALREERAISGNPATGGATVGSRDEQVTLPSLGKPNDMGMFSKKDGTTQWSAQVYSTKEGDTTKLLAEVLASDTNYDGTRLNFASPSSADPKIKSPSFPQESGTRTYPPDNRQFSGTYQGASGMYSCSATTCTAKWTTAGILLSSGWVFTPADGARAVIADANYQSYGWWLRKNADGTMDAGPVHFTTPTDLAATGIAALEGSATYEGSAVGKYAIYSGAFSERSEAGHFTADVRLDAEFGDGTEAGTISGMINGFKTEAGDKDDWSVALRTSTELSDSAASTGATAWKIGTVTSGETGGYSVRLYDTGKSGQDGVPYEAGGTFDAPFEGGVGEMVGAFGATRKKR